MSNNTARVYPTLKTFICVRNTLLYCTHANRELCQQIDYCTLTCPAAIIGNAIGETLHFRALYYFLRICFKLNQLISTLILSEKSLKILWTSPIKVRKTSTKVP